MPGLEMLQGNVLSLSPSCSTALDPQEEANLFGLENDDTGALVFIS